MADAKSGPRVPESFWQHIRSLGPGLVVALTWLGAGDLVDSAVAGGNYGYTLMWAMALALFVRFVFVSIVAKYQLCNQHGESVLSGLKRVHPAMPLFVVVVAVIFGHIYGSFLVRGLGLASEALLGFGAPFVWSAFWVSAAAVFVFRGLYRRLEPVFYVFLAMLSISVIGVAAWSGPDPVAAAKGVLLFEVPEQQGSYGALLVIVSLIGAVGGSIANLLYPYFIQQKGWRGPRFRRVQLYDLAFGLGLLMSLRGHHAVLDGGQDLGGRRRALHLYGHEFDTVLIFLLLQLLHHFKVHLGALVHDAGHRLGVADVAQSSLHELKADALRVHVGP